MKFAIRAWIPLVAAAWLAASTTLAGQPDGPNQTTRYRTTSSAIGRLGGSPSSHDTSLLEEPETVEAPAANQEKGPAGPETVWDDLGEGCDDCSTCGPLQRGMWYGSVDYLLMRPRFSQGVAEVRRTLVTDSSTTPTVSTLTDQAVEFAFPYQSGFRAALGYRLLDCGGDIQVSYWRMNATTQISSGPADTINDNPFIAGQLKNNPGDGGFLFAEAGVTANIFDVDFAKCISLGGPQGDCDCCYCPRWDLRWSAGARAADISRFDNNLTTTPAGTTAPTDTITTGIINARFVGAGPRVGIQGRRYFGCNGFLSLYAKASQAILIGDYRMSRVKTTPGDQQTPTEVTAQYDRFSRTIPVTDIEVGGSWQLAPFTYISVGYFFQCWWDLGQSESVIGTNFGPLDTANILGFDGLFVRGELLF